MFIFQDFWCFNVCSFAHLLCVHIVFEQNFVFPLFFLPSQLHCTSPSLHQNTSPKWLTPSFSICIRDVIQEEQKCCACCKKWYKVYYSNYYSEGEMKNESAKRLNEISIFSTEGLLRMTELTFVTGLRSCLYHPTWAQWPSLQCSTEALGDEGPQELKDWVRDNS